MGYLVMLKNPIGRLLAILDNTQGMNGDRNIDSYVPVMSFLLTLAKLDS